MEKSRKMKNFDIKFYDDVVIVRTIDNIGFPIDVWRFERDKLTPLEKVFISNIESMTSSMITERDNPKK